MNHSLDAGEVQEIREDTTVGDMNKSVSARSVKSTGSGSQLYDEDDFDE